MIIFGDGIIIETSKVKGIFINVNDDKFSVKADMNNSYAIIKQFDNQKDANNLLEKIYNNWSQNVTSMRV
jgi:biotin-(acetyl-CoA carboxylase) ligase